MGRSWAYARLKCLVSGSLLEQRTLLYRQPGLYIAPAEALRWRVLERLGVYRVGPGGFRHAAELASVAVALHGAFSRWELLSERQIRAAEAERGELIASAKLGEFPGGRPALHRPDLALLSAGGCAVAVELELSSARGARARRSARRGSPAG